jgi:hypothetical protein
MMPDVLSAWDSIVLFTTTDKWFSTRSITDLKTEFQRLIQSMSNAGVKHTATKSSGRNSGASKLRQSIDDDIAAGRIPNPSGKV